MSAGRLPSPEWDVRHNRIEVNAFRVTQNPSKSQSNAFRATHLRSSSTQLRTEHAAIRNSVVDRAWPARLPPVETTNAMAT